MMNLCSLSKARIASAAAGVVAVVALVGIVLVDPVPRLTAAALLILVLALVGLTLWSLHTATSVLDEAAAVCRRAYEGDLEARVLKPRQPGRLGLMQKSINDMLDIADAFVREASASMEAASHGRRHRKILVRGLPGAFRHSAGVINGGTEVLGQRVMEIAGLSKRFGTRLDEITGGLAKAATDLENDAAQMAAAAEETSRQSDGVMAASDQASNNVQTVATSAEQLSSSISEIGRQVHRSKESTSRAVN